MPEHKDKQLGMDTGLNTLAAIARFHQLLAEPSQISHEFGRLGEDVTDTDMLRAAKAMMLKTKCIKPSLSEVTPTILLTIAKTKEGAYIIVVSTTQNGENKNARLMLGLVVTAEVEMGGRALLGTHTAL